MTITGATRLFAIVGDPVAPLRSPAVFNAANEVAVAAFLDGRIAFRRIAEVIEEVLQAHRIEPVRELETVRAADQWARAHAHGVLA